MATHRFYFEKLNRDNAVRVILNPSYLRNLRKQVRTTKILVNGLSKLKKVLDKAQVGSTRAYKLKQKEQRLPYEMRVISQLWSVKVTHLEVDAMKIFREVLYLGCALSFFPSLKYFKFDVGNRHFKVLYFLSTFTPSSQLYIDFGSVLKSYSNYFSYVDINVHFLRQLTRVEGFKAVVYCGYRTLALYPGFVEARLESLEYGEVITDFKGNFLIDLLLYIKH